eukprot:c12319_g2_i1.p1 GENE.c12319_g2_i1~~c12319_g2_i1.p1  ORF type:complete len:117 (-),score=45.27 c12319_g2_i1:257-607(-)
MNTKQKYHTTDNTEKGDIGPQQQNQNTALQREAEQDRQTNKQTKRRNGNGNGNASSQDDPNTHCVIDLATSVPEGLAISLPRFEYTPPDFITLLFSDLGVLTPSAVSDELIKLYLN